MPEYPKFLHHPSYQPPDLDVMGAGMEKPRGVAATRYPPVVVHNAAQEAEYVHRRGYSPGSYSQAKIDQMKIAPKPNGYQEKQYPMYAENGEVIEDPNPGEPGIDPHEYPKYVGDVIVYSPEEERRVIIESGLPDPVQEEYERVAKRMAELAAKLGFKQDQPPPTEKTVAVIKAAAARKAPPRYGKPKSLRSPEQTELLVLCAEAGLKVDSRYSVAHLREMLEQATAPVGQRGTIEPSTVEPPVDAKQDP